MRLDLPLYNILPPTEEDTGLLLVSFVEDPAVEIDFLKFKKDNEFNFSVQNEEQRIITGVSILADTPIYRRKGDYEFYVNFTPETIKALVEKYMKEGLQNFIDIEHDQETITDKKAVLVESYFVNKERGICPKEFEEVTDGSWITSYKILDDELWNFIKENGAKGFSIEIVSELEEAKNYSRDNSSTVLDDPYNELIEIFGLSKKDAPEGKSNVVDVINNEIKSVEEITSAGIDLDSFNESSVRYAVTNRKWVMIRYSGTSASGFRQCAIGGVGTTLAGNRAMWVYQPFGSTESGRYDWKLLLWKDIDDMRVLGFAPSWTDGETGFTGITADSMSSVEYQS